VRKFIRKIVKWLTPKKEYIPQNQQVQLDIARYNQFMNGS